MTYYQILLKKIEEKHFLESQLSNLNKEIELLNQLNNLDSLNPIYENQKDEKRLYDKTDINNMSASEVQNIFNKYPVTVKYLRKNNKVRTFMFASFNEDYKNVFFEEAKRTAGSNVQIGNTKYDNMVCLIESCASEYIFRNLLKDRIISIEIH